MTPETLLARCQRKSEKIEKLETVILSRTDYLFVDGTKVLLKDYRDTIIADVLKEVREELEGLVKINNLLDTEEEQDLIDAEEEFVTYYNQALTDAQNLLIGEGKK
jgi:hypothetical protein